MSVENPEIVQHRQTWAPWERYWHASQFYKRCTVALSLLTTETMRLKEDWIYLFISVWNLKHMN